MDRSFSNIAEEALKLPSNEQLRLARTLLESNEATGDLGAEAAWEDESERRIQMVAAGLAKGRSFDEVLRDVNERFG